LTRLSGGSSDASGLRFTPEMWRASQMMGEALDISVYKRYTSRIRKQKISFFLVARLEHSILEKQEIRQEYIFVRFDTSF